MQYSGSYYENKYEKAYRPYRPVVTILLLAANILYFIWLEWKGSTNDGYFMAQHGTLIAGYVIERGEYYRLLTSFFMHFGISHLINNMILLGYLGSRLEKYLGHVKYAITYLLCGLIANVVSLIFYLFTEPYANCAGASGAAFGIVGAMLWVVLRHRGRLADLTGRQLTMMIVFSLYNGFASIDINNTAHVTGLITGYLLGMLFYRGGSSIRRWLQNRKNEERWVQL